jgi:glyoxylase-like metal-dependent hydrolase (beta-lactamase superfamily II)
VTFHIDGEEVIVIPAPKPSHTDGDSFVYFSKSNVLATGDVYNGNYPAINAGDSQGLMDNWNFIIELTDSNTKIIPGHGQIFTKADVIALRDAMLTIYDRMRRMIAEGMTFDQVKAARPTREFDARFSVEQEGRNELRTTDAWLKGTYDMLSLEAKVKP